MSNQGKRTTLLVLVGASSAAAALLLILFPLVGGSGQKSITNTISTHPAAPATDPAPGTAPADAPAIQTYLDVVKALHPDFPTTQPLPGTLELREAAKFIFDAPLYLDGLGHLWITLPGGDPLRVAIKRATRETTHVVRETVRFVHRQPDANGVWQPQAVVDRSDGSGFDLVTTTGRRAIGERRDYLWRRAFSWNENLVVPTATGVSIFRPEQLPVEIHEEFKSEAADETTQRSTTNTLPATAPERESASEPQVLLDYRGLIAWLPAGATSETRADSSSVHRFVDGRWSVLAPPDGWPTRVLHVVPLLDGGLLILKINDDHTTSLVFNQLDPATEADPKPIEDLVSTLSDPDPDKRDEAHKQLSRYGQRSWPVLERLLPDQPPEAAERIRQLLAAKLAPTLGRMTLLPGTTTVFSRLRDGGVVLLSEGGVTVPRAGRPDAEPGMLAPAWISVRPGRPIEPLSPWLLADIRPDARIDAWGDEWIVTDPVKGPQRLLGNHLEPILPRKYKTFSRLIGIDRAGRWLLREHIDDNRTLLIDPTLPDATPTLPVWQNPAASAEAVGWTEAGWPVMKRGGAYVLDVNGWRPLDAKNERMLTELPAHHSETRPSTEPATLPSTRDMPLLIDADGNRYFDGMESLHVIQKSGRDIVWPLPPAATGLGDIWLLKSEDRLFLFNQPGRVLRVRFAPASPEPFNLEATFVRGVPTAAACSRIWKDPAGRFVMAYAGNQLAILFPTGHIPPEIEKLMPASELQRNEEEDK